MTDRDKILNAMRMVYSKTSAYIKFNLEKEFKPVFDSKVIDKKHWDDLFKSLQEVYFDKIEKEMPK